MGRLTNIKFAIALGRTGTKILNDLDNGFDEVSEYIENLPTEQEQTIATYVYVAKILSCVSETERESIIENLKKVNYEKMKR